jgi:hypothetical protein
VGALWARCGRGSSALGVDLRPVRLLALVGAVRRIAYDRTLPPSEAMGRIRDAFHDYDEGGVRD